MLELEFSVRYCLSCHIMLKILIISKQNRYSLTRMSLPLVKTILFLNVTSWKWMSIAFKTWLMWILTYCIHASIFVPGCQLQFLWRLLKVHFTPVTSSELPINSLSTAHKVYNIFSWHLKLLISWLADL